jgi:hydrogenase expression/formation protein HypD
LEKINNLADHLADEKGKPIKIMHVCGTHEYTVANNGLRSLLTPRLEIIAGPGCPVCVCPSEDILIGIEIAKRTNVILTSFGDMMRVPADNMTLNDIGAKGADIRVVYGPNDAVKIARENPEKEVVFFSVGFETTTPLIAFELANDPPKNFSVIISNRLVPPALDLLMQLPDNELDGFLMPGHVSAILGSKIYEPLVERYNVPMVIGGFEINDVLISLLIVLKQIEKKVFKVENSYSRLVKPEGNEKAQAIVEQVFEAADSNWRGIGIIPNSGMKIKEKYQQYDATIKFKIELPKTNPIPIGCICHKVILGKAKPKECIMFGKKCVPEKPYGPCMVSHEGTCRIAHMFSE